MISILIGSVEDIQQEAAVILCNNIGYKILMAKKDIDLLTYGKQYKFYVHTHIREDAISLFGFLNKPCRDFFEIFITAKGIGPKTAINAMGILNSEQIITAILEKDITLLSSLPSIGKKSAERIILDTKDKLSKLNFNFAIETDKNSLSDLVMAIKDLGFSTEQAYKAKKHITENDLLSLPLEDMVKESLKNILGN